MPQWFEAVPIDSCDVMEWMRTVFDASDRSFKGAAEIRSRMSVRPFKKVGLSVMEESWIQKFVRNHNKIVNSLFCNCPVSEFDLAPGKRVCPEKSGKNFRVFRLVRG
jgi:hypothetical protein